MTPSCHGLGRMLCTLLLCTLLEKQSSQMGSLCRRAMRAEAASTAEISNTGLTASIAVSPPCHLLHIVGCVLEAGIRLARTNRKEKIEGKDNAWSRSVSL